MVRHFLWCNTIWSYCYLVLVLGMYNDCAICLKQYFFKHRHEHLGIKQGKNVEENIVSDDWLTHYSLIWFVIFNLLHTWKQKRVQSIFMDKIFLIKKSGVWWGLDIEYKFMSIVCGRNFDFYLRNILLRIARDFKQSFGKKNIVSKYIPCITWYYTSTLTWGSTNIRSFH